jgi:hypothetical protein
VVSYDFTIQGDAISLTAHTTPLVLSLNASRGDSSSAADGSAAGSLAGIEWYGYKYLQARDRLFHNTTDNSYTVYPSGTLGFQYEQLYQDYYSSYAGC